MNIDINLLTERGNYYKIEKIFQNGRKLTVVIGIVAVVGLASLLILKQSTQAQIAENTIVKRSLENEIAQSSDRVAKIKLIGNKIVDMNKIRNTAPDFGSYYNTIEKYLPADSSQGQLKKISMSSPNVVVIEVDFPDILALSRFLGVVESEGFLSEFESVRFSNVIFTKGTDELSLTIHLTFNEKV